MFYHQGRFDSALVRLQALESQGPWKHRDSLSLFQYLGMASARLGRESEAADYFSGLLGLDSLFQFPRNEDPQVLQAFTQALARKAADQAAPPLQEAGASAHVPVPVPVSPGAPSPAGAKEKFSLIDSGSMGQGGGRPERMPAGERNIGLALGAVPLGAGWLARHKIKHGVSLGLLQAGGIALSLYASKMQTDKQRDAFGIENNELASIHSWQWVQRVSLSTALGAYLFSLIASAGN